MESKILHIYEDVRKCPRSLRLLFMLLLIPFVSMAQERIVSGKVTAIADGTPLPGVSVIIKGSTNGTSTDADGAYKISVPSSETILVFSFIGMASEEVVVGAKTTLDISLTADVTQLSEVVVIGYGTQRQEAVTGSVVSLSGDKMRDIPSPNITTALQGRLAGVELQQTSSQPGAAMQIRVRGTRSLNATNDPLIVLDGIPFAGSISDINPNDIKSVDILKDASATAIYGSRGANGVILVTTNKGKQGQKAQFSYNSYYGVKKVFAKYPMMNGEDFIKLRTAAGVYSTPGLDEVTDGSVNTDWQDLFYRTAAMTSHDIGVNGGTDNGSYNLGFGYYRDEAVIPGQDYNRFSLRTSIDQGIGNYIRVGFTTNTNYSITNGSNISNQFYNVLTMSPIADPYNSDGSIKRTIHLPADEYWTTTKETVNALGDNWIDKSKAIGSYNSLYADIKIPGVKGLSYRVNGGLNYRQVNSGQFTGQGVFNTNATTVSSASITNTLTTSWTIENLLTYERTFADKHNVNLLGLYSAQKDFSNSSTISVKDIQNSAFQFYNLGATTQTPVIDPAKQLYTVSGLESAMARLMYSYDDRFMLQASYRFDGSSRLAEGHKWISYPAVSVGWNLTKESFMENISQISRLKLRAGYGTTSTQSISPYSTLGLLGSRAYNFGNTNSTGYYVSTLPNPNLGWEYSTTMNYALEFGVWNNRLTGTVEYYNTTTNNLLFTVSLPSTSGVSSYVANVGESQNKGVELTLNGLILDNPEGFTWEAGFNLYANRNELTKLASGQTRDESNWWFVGHPIDVVYDYQAIGLWQQDDKYLTTYEPGGNVGMIKVKYTGDYNADGTPTRAIGAADRQIMNMQAKFQGGFNTRLAYKGFDLSIVGIFKHGGLLIATPYGSSGYLNILTGRRGNIDVDYWTPDNTNAKYPKPGGIGGDSPKYLNSLSYFDASYLKVRTITLGYNFEQRFGWLKKKGINRLRLYTTVQNPFVLFSPYNRASGMDPETNSYGNQNAAVTSTYNSRLLTTGTNTPSTRNYVFGLNLTF